MVDRDRVKDELRQSKMQVAMRGHDWDVADVMEVLDRLRLVPEHGLSPGPGGRSSP